MAQQIINIGVADAGLGDDWFDAFTKVKANFAELYAGADGPLLAISQTDYAAPATAIYLGGLWSDDGRWQVSKFVAGVQTRATLANNGAITTLAAAWTARGSLTYA